MSEVEIYGLYDPDTDALRYVGKANSAEYRLKTHLQERRLNRPVCRWIKSLTEQGKAPVVRILERVAKDDWESAERRLIALHRKTSHLLNVADGGATPKCSPAQRRKAARAALKARDAGPLAQLHKAKFEMARLLGTFMRTKSYAHAYILRFRMRLDAVRRPELYGEWASL